MVRFDHIVERGGVQSIYQHLQRGERGVKPCRLLDALHNHILKMIYLQAKSIAQVNTGVFVCVGEFHVIQQQKTRTYVPSARQ